MKKLIIFLLFSFSVNLNTSEIKLEKIVDSLKKPWSLTFIDQENIIFTEKKGKLYTLNLQDKKISEIKHNLSILVHGQGGLLDVLYKDEHVYVSYSENRGNGNSSTSVAKGKYSKENINFKNIFRAEPPINSGYHFGSRLVIKDKNLYITAG